MSEFPKEFKECPVCQHNETLTRLAWEEGVAEGWIGESSKDLFVCARIEQPTQLIDPKRGIVLSAKLLVRYLDNCAKCGFEYCVKAEIVTALVQMGKLPGDDKLPPGGFRPNDPRFS